MGNLGANAEFARYPQNAKRPGSCPFYRRSPSSVRPKSTLRVRDPTPACPARRKVLVTACGRICMHRKRINISTVFAGRRLGINEVEDGSWIISFTHYDLGLIDLCP